MGKGKCNGRSAPRQTPEELAAEHAQIEENWARSEAQEAAQHGKNGLQDRFETLLNSVVFAGIEIKNVSKTAQTVGLSAFGASFDFHSANGKLILPLPDHRARKVRKAWVPPPISVNLKLDVSDSVTRQSAAASSHDAEVAEEEDEQEEEQDEDGTQSSGDETSSDEEQASEQSSCEGDEDDEL